MRRSVYFTNLTHTGNGVNSNSFPFGIGVVAAYAARELAGRVELELFKFPHNLNESLSRKMPHILCMSNICDNLNLSYTFAEYVKRVSPETIVVFGGPNIPAVPEGRKAFLLKRPVIDFYIKWDGELAFVNLFKGLSECDFNVDYYKRNRIISENCCYLAADDYMEGPDHSLLDFQQIPSAYTTGMMDKFFGQSLNPIVETTRGCPYSCTYCNDGVRFKQKVIHKQPEIIEQELAYIATRIHDTAELWLCDDNFGMFREDMLTSQIIRDCAREHGWPYSVQASNGKSHPERILESRRIINANREGAMRFGASLQSTNEEVLKLIKRRNLPTERLLQLAHFKGEQNSNRIGFFTELILALPGDSLKKHFHSLRYAIDKMGVSNIDIHQLNLLNGSEMADLNDRTKYDLDSRFRVFIGCYGVYQIGEQNIGCAEIDEVVVANNTLSFEDYMQCRIMDLLVKIYIDHEPFQEIFGLLRHFKLSLFDLLCILKDKFLLRYDSLSNLVADFVENTTKPLFENRDEIEEFISQKENIEKYISGEIGINELLAGKASALLNCCDDIHECLQDAALAHLENHGLLTDEICDYVKQAIQFSRMRKFDPIDMTSPKKGIFTFDFMKAQKKGYQVNPAEYRSEPLEMVFYHDQKTLDFIKSRLDSWGGQTVAQFGKVFQKTNMELMSRHVCLASDALQSA